MVAERINAYIKDMGIKQIAVANAIGVSKATMSQILKGERKLSADEYAAICRHLNVPYETFLEEVN